MITIFLWTNIFKSSRVQTYKLASQKWGWAGRQVGSYPREGLSSVLSASDSFLENSPHIITAQACLPFLTEINTNSVCLVQRLWSTFSVHSSEYGINIMKIRPLKLFEESFVVCFHVLFCCIFFLKSNQSPPFNIKSLKKHSEGITTKYTAY